MDTDNLDTVNYNRDEWKTLDELPPAEITERIIACAYKVSNTLGAGFLEKVYENSLAHEMKKVGFQVAQQQRMRVLYDHVEVGFYEADIIVDEKIIIEVKALKALTDAHKAQCLNYLKATGLRLALLINFGTSRIEVRRVAL